MRKRALIAVAAVLAGGTGWAFTSEPGAGTASTGVPSNVTITVDVAQGRIPISPYIYGRNLDVTKENLARVRDSGMTIIRGTDGNNSTRYNWQTDLSVHPDWYNNVYKQGWPDRARKIQDELPGVQGLFCFPVLGWAATTDEYNTRDTSSERHANKCGDGDYTKYSEAWSAKDSVDMAEFWFNDPEGLKLDPSRFKMFHLDNEPDCWASTHDDVPKMTAEECVQKFAAVAKEVRTRFPEIQIMAPGFASEWFWYFWSDHKLPEKLAWIEYFIKRMGEESKAFGKPLLDMIDIHAYCAASDSAPDEAFLQEYRVLYDPTYEHPGANAVRMYTRSKGAATGVEMIFARAEQWLDQYWGPGHGVGLASTEASCDRKGPMIGPLWYAGYLGTMADHGVRVFTMWGWADGMWEVMHLFTRYAGVTRVASVSSDDPKVSAFSSLSADGKTLTVILVHRLARVSMPVTLSVKGFAVAAAPQEMHWLADLPAEGVTFKSHQENALRHGTVQAGKDGRISLTLPPYTITALVLKAKGGAIPDVP